MKSLGYGWYDYQSIGEDIKGRKVWGTEPKISKEPNNEFLEIKTRSKNNSGYGYTPSYKGLSLDNARDIITIIHQLDKDIKRYEELGILKETVNYGRGNKVIETNFYKVSLNCQKTRDKLYELL